MLEQLIFAGFGGQGVLLMGQLVTYAGMKEDKNVSWLPSYGPEMRGGTANCNVIVSDEPVGTPLVTQGSAVIVMNKPSLAKFESFVAPGGKLFVNSSLIDVKAKRTDIDVYYVPVSDIAGEIGNMRVANMVMLGAVVKKVGMVKAESIMEALKNTFGAKKEHLLDVNRTALERGAAAV